MVKKRVIPINNELSAKVLLTINTQKKYATEISRELNLPQPNIFRELKSLQEERFLIAHRKNNNPKNKKVFSVDWDKICSKFVIFCIDKIKTYQKKFTNIRRNKYIIELLKISFVENYLLYKRNSLRLKTINEIFEDLFNQIIYHIPPHTHMDLVKKAKQERQLRLFLEFTRFLEKNISTHQADIVEEFYHQIVEDGIYMGTSKKNN